MARTDETPINGGVIVGYYEKTQEAEPALTMGPGEPETTPSAPAKKAAKKTTKKTSKK